MTSPTKAASGTEQSEAVFSTIVVIWVKFTGHLPVRFGWYELGKVGYIGDRGSAGYTLWGSVDGEISIGSKMPIGGSDKMNLFSGSKSDLRDNACWRLKM